MPTTICLTRLPDMGMGTDDQICTGINAGMGDTALPRRRHMDILITPMEIGHDKTAVGLKSADDASQPRWPLAGGARQPVPGVGVAGGTEQGEAHAITFENQRRECGPLIRPETKMTNACLPECCER